MQAVNAIFVVKRRREVVAGYILQVYRLKTMFRASQDFLSSFHNVQPETCNMQRVGYKVTWL